MSRRPPKYVRGAYLAGSARLALMALVAASVDCRSRSQAQLQQAAAGATDASQAVLPYPRARWRLAPPAALNHTVLWVSHILIRHEHSDRTAAFAPSWNVEPPPPARTRAVALAVANSIAAQASAAPETFASLARKYSEDIVTQAMGGSLGGITAGRLVMDSSVLDALAALRAGQVSRVVETRHGFHVLLRRSPPDIATLSARRILVTYDGVVAPGNGSNPAGRSRDEALAIARDVAVEIRADPRKFDGLLAKYSPAEELERHGEIGVWTNQEPGGLEREREQIAALAVGEVSDPIDGTEGFEVFTRTAIPVGRATFHVQLIKIRYSPNAPAQSEGSRDDGLRLALSAAQAIRNAPDQFEAMQHKYCCMTPERWSSGRTPPRLIDAVANLPIGGTNATPIEDGSSFILIKRVDPNDVVPPQTLFDIPEPKTVEVERLAAGSWGTAVHKLILGLGEEAPNVLGLAPDEARQLKTLHQQLAEAFLVRDSRDKREQALARFSEQLHQVLTPDQYERYEQFTNDRVSQKMMGQW